MKIPAALQCARVATGLAMALLVGGCVYPMPLDGEPMPALVLTASSASASEIVVTATPVNFAPDRVEFRMDKIRNAPEIDTTSPFEFTVSTADHGAGPHEVLALGVTGDALFVGERLPLELTRPNVVFLLVDDLDQTKTPYWDAMPKTRALVADRGVEFANGFVVDPICCPAKATFLTGRYGHNVGVFDNTPPDGGFQAFKNSGAQNDTIATRLRAAGYSTAFFGKYLNGYPGTSVPPGWDEWFGLYGLPWLGYGYKANHNGVQTTYGDAPEDYQTDVLAQTAQDYLQSTETDDAQPFFAVVSVVAPHAYIPPAPRHDPNPFADAEIPVTPNLAESDVSDKPTWLRDGFPATTPEDVASETDDHRRRLGSLLAVDDLVDGMATTLSANGELDETVFVFASDNGFNLLSHRLKDKTAPYDESIRIPFAMSGPGVRSGTEDAFVTNLDLAPTLLHLAGVDGADDLDGRSLLPLLRGEDSAWRSDFLVEFNGTYTGAQPVLDTYDDVLAAIAANGRLDWVPTYRAVRSREWLYVEWYAGDVHEYELYEMVGDPYQLENLVSTPEGAAAHAVTTAVLHARLDELRDCAAERCRA